MKRAAQKYQAEHIKAYAVKVNDRTEADILEHLRGKANVSGYIKDLIRKDIKRHS
jgi:hypothetical protein